MTDIQKQPKPFLLQVAFVDRVWGKKELRPWYEHTSSTPVGEAWLTGEQCVVETGPLAGRKLADVQRELGGALLGPFTEFPLLVKMLFPQEKLSVQVHPDDGHAAALGGDARAKTECWYVLQADAGATVALGFREGVSEADVRTGLGTPRFEDMLQAVPVQAGDLVYVEAGTVHAIGPGMVLLEVQQTSDTTYRLYDYGRPRELHLDLGGRVIKLENGSGKVQPKVLAHGTELISVPHFAVERLEVSGGTSVTAETAGRPECLIALEGSAYVNSGSERLALPPGQAVLVPAVCAAYSLEGQGSVIRVRVPIA